MGGKPTYQELEQKPEQEQDAERSRVEQIMRECEQRFRTLYEKTPRGYQALDVNGSLLEVDEAWLEMLGYTRQEVIGRYFGEFLHPELQGCFKDNFPRFMAVGELLGVECEMVRKDGSMISVFLNGTISKDETGSFSKAHCVLHDITSLRQAEEENERLAEELQKARAEIETLQAMLPLCGRCGANRINAELSKKMQTYIAQHTEAELSHCLCQDCKVRDHNWPDLA